MTLEKNSLNYIVAIDEYQRDNILVVLAALIPTTNLLALVDKHKELRGRIKSHLVENYPGAAEHEDLRGDLLPEIHAYELVQSEGYYRKHRAPRGDSYYEQHYGWLEDSLQIARNHGVQLLESTSLYPYPKDTKTCQIILDNFRTYEMQFGQRASIDYEELEKVCDAAFLINLSNLLFHIESLLSENDSTYKVIIDDRKGDKLKEPLKVVDSFHWLFDTGEILQTLTPEFEESKKEVVLQVVDNFCYLVGNAFHAQHNDLWPEDNSPKQNLISLYENFVAPLRRDNDMERFQHGNHTILHLLSVLNERCTKNPQAREFIRGRIKEDFDIAKKHKLRIRSDKA